MYLNVGIDSNLCKTNTQAQFHNLRLYLIVSTTEVSRIFNIWNKNLGFSQEIFNTNKNIPGLISIQEFGDQWNG